jgi:hypothetical protein
MHAGKYRWFCWYVPHRFFFASAERRKTMETRQAEIPEAVFPIPELFLVVIISE